MTIEEFYYKEKLQYEIAIKLVTAYLQPFTQQPGALISTIKARLKELSSLKEKCSRKRVTAKDVAEKIRDIAGVRCICDLITQVDDLTERIRCLSLPGFVIKKEKDYNKHPKRNGYTAFHFDCEVTVPTVQGNVSVPVEIQIRTIAQESRGDIEHDHYKQLLAEGKTYEEDSDKNNEILSEISEHVSEIDRLALKLYDIER